MNLTGASVFAPWEQPAGGTVDQRIVRLPDPAAGTEPIFVVPGQKVWRPLSLTGVIHTSAVAGSRHPQLVVDDGTNEVCRLPARNFVGPGINRRYAWVGRMTWANITIRSDLFQANLPDLALPAGWRLRFVSLLFDTGDTWDVATMLVQQWSAPPDPQPERIS